MQTEDDENSKHPSYRNHSDFRRLIMLPQMSVLDAQNCDDNIAGRCC